MENQTKSIKNRLLDYFKKTIFFKVNREDKDYVRKETLKSDHITFKTLLIFIFLCQLCMILFKVITSTIECGVRNWAPWDVQYIVCYIFLAFSTAVLYPISEYYVRNNRPAAYFVTVAIGVNLIFVWGCAVALIDSGSKGAFGCEITTFSYVSLALAAFVVLEPWVFILDSICYSTIMLILFNVIPGLKFGSHLLISIVSVSLLTCIAATANFRKKVESLMVKKENEQLNESFKLSVYRDELTNVHNRRYLTEHIDDPVNIGLHPSGVLMFDIDYFKNINDQYGHQNGDIILGEVGKIINECCNSEKNSYSVRFGGDEFLIFLPHTTQPEIIQFSEKLRKLVEDKDFVLLEGTVVKVRISIGCSIAIAGINYSGLINIADNNLYEAKRTGRNKTMFS